MGWRCELSRHPPHYLTFTTPSRLAKAGLCQCLYTEVNLVSPPTLDRHRLQALEPMSHAWLYDKLEVITR